MTGRVVLGIVTIVVVIATWSKGLPHAVAHEPAHRTGDATSLFAAVLPRDNALIPALDAAYWELDAAMRPHGCLGCHAPELESGGRHARVRHAAQLLDSRRALEEMLDANLMPPEADGHAPGIADEPLRRALRRRAKVFRALGDAAFATW